MYGVVQGFVNAPRLHGGRGLGDKHGVEVRFGLGELFTPQPDRAEDIFRCTIRDAGIEEQLVSVVGEGRKEEGVSPAVIAFDVGAHGEDAEAGGGVGKFEGVFVGVVVQERGEVVILVELNVPLQLLVEFFG